MQGECILNPLFKTKPIDKGKRTWAIDLSIAARILFCGVPFSDPYICWASSLFDHPSQRLPTRLLQDGAHTHILAHVPHCNFGSHSSKPKSYNSHIFSNQTIHGFGLFSTCESCPYIRRQRGPNLLSWSQLRYNGVMSSCPIWISQCNRHWQCLWYDTKLLTTINN